MNVLVLSDSHGHLPELEKIVHEAKERLGQMPDFMLHCGDLGLFNEDDLSQLSGKERYLIKKHGNPIRHFRAYLRGEKKFPLPLYAIPGNHEDFSLVEKLTDKSSALQDRQSGYPAPKGYGCGPVDGKVYVENLYLMRAGEILSIPESKTYVHTETNLSEINIQGLGKIISKRDIPDKDLMPKYLKKSEYDYAWSEADRLRREQRRNIDIFFSHEPPYLEKHDQRCSFGNPRINKLIQHARPALVFSGHLHFAYRSSILLQSKGKNVEIPLFGVAAASEGNYALLRLKDRDTQKGDFNSEVSAKSIERFFQVDYFLLGRDSALRDVPYLQPGDEKKFYERIDRLRRRTITPHKIIKYFSLQEATQQMQGFHGSMGGLIARIREMEKKGEIASYEQALEFSRKFLKEKGILR